MKKSIFTILTAMLLCALLCCGCAYAEETQTDWYIEKADALKAELALLCADSAYLSAYGTDEELLAMASDWSETISAEPIRTGRYSIPSDLLILGAMGAAPDDLSETALKLLRRTAGSSVLTMSCAAQGVNFLSAASILRISEGYLMPKGFEPCLILYEYEDICIGVTFSECGEGVVMAHASVCTENIKQYSLSLDGAGGVLTQDDEPSVPLSDRTQNTDSGSKRGK